MNNKLIKHIDTITAKFMESFGDLNEESLNWKPDAATWSIAQNIDHLIQLNSSYFPAFENLKKGKQQLPFIARFRFVVSFFGKMISKSVDPDRKKKMKTFGLWEPEKDSFQKRILTDFKENQEELKRYIVESDDLISQGAVISSPVNRNIVYKLETAFEIIITHEERHYNQAKEIQDQIPGNQYKNFNNQP